jgi:hypothetical protein
MMALKRLPKETFGILISMEPAVAALWAMLLLHEHLHGLQWLAIGCTVLASVGSTMTARRLKVPVTMKGTEASCHNVGPYRPLQRRALAGTSIAMARAR